VSKEPNAALAKYIAAAQAMTEWKKEKRKKGRKENEETK